MLILLLLSFMAENGGFVGSTKLRARTCVHQDVTYVQFLDRVHEEETVLRSAGMWEVPHPWLNLFIPRSHILDFDTGAFKGLLRDANPAGVIL